LFSWFVIRHNFGCCWWLTDFVLQTTNIFCRYRMKMYVLSSSNFTQLISTVVSLFPLNCYEKLKRHLNFDLDLWNKLITFYPLCIKADISAMCCAGKCTSLPSWRDDSLTTVLYCQQRASCGKFGCPMCWRPG
jgi:hypothetical protein